jgi:hypothetical protein
VVNQTCVPQVDLEVEVTNSAGAIQPGSPVDATIPGAPTQYGTADGAGRARFTFAGTSTYVHVHAHVNGLRRDAYENFACASTPRFGYLASHIYTLRVPPGRCPHPNPAITGCVNTGDTLPVGGAIYYLFGVFDTGSTIVGIDNVAKPNGLFSDARTLALCRLNDNCIIPSNAAQHDPYLPIPLDVRIWGLGAVVAGTLDAPLDSPQQEVTGIQVRPLNTVNTLIGAPVAARSVAVIDYGTIVSRRYTPVAGTSYTVDSPDITFYSSAAAAPTPTYRFPLVHHGSFTSAFDGATVGPRFLTPTAVFRTSARSASGQTLRFLFDTGNSATQITEQVARSLGIDLNVRPNDTATIGTTSGPIAVKGYIIDRFEMTTADGAAQYAIQRPMVYVRPNRSDGSPAFPDNVDAVIGSNYFWNVRVVFDGPGLRLGTFALHP